jgi:FkbM family methyltransferase
VTDALLNARKIATRVKRIPGTRPLLELVRKHFYGRGKITVADFDGSLKMRLDLGEHMASQIFWFGFYSRDILCVLDRLLKLRNCFFDVGANIGEVSLFAAKRVGPEGSVVAFEPIAEICEALRHNVALNGFNDTVEIVAAAASNKSGTDAIYTRGGDFNDGSWHSGLGTLYADDVRSHLVGMVPLIALNELNSTIVRLDGIKLDIEGAELAALEGARDLLDRFRPWLIVEIGETTCRAAGYEPADILKLLRHHNYRFFDIGRMGKLRALTETSLRRWQNVLCIQAP